MNYEEAIAAMLLIIAAMLLIVVGYFAVSIFSGTFFD